MFTIVGTDPQTLVPQDRFMRDLAAEKVTKPVLASLVRDGLSLSALKAHPLNIIIDAEDVELMRAEPSLMYELLISKFSSGREETSALHASRRTAAILRDLAKSNFPRAGLKTIAALSRARTDDYTSAAVYDNGIAEILKLRPRSVNEAADHLAGHHLVFFGDGYKATTHQPDIKYARLIRNKTKFLLLVIHVAYKLMTGKQMEHGVFERNKLPPLPEIVTVLAEGTPKRSLPKTATFRTQLWQLLSAGFDRFAKLQPYQLAKPENWPKYMKFRPEFDGIQSKLSKLHDFKKVKVITPTIVHGAMWALRQLEQMQGLRLTHRQSNEAKRATTVERRGRNLREFSAADDDVSLATELRPAPPAPGSQTDESRRLHGPQPPEAQAHQAPRDNGKGAGRSGTAGPDDQGRPTQRQRHCEHRSPKGYHRERAAAPAPRPHADEQVRCSCRQ